MKQILFRVDSSNVIGTGHIYRTRNLARELKSRGAEVIFVSRSHSGNVIDILLQEFRVLRLKPNLPSVNIDSTVINSSDDSSYAHWLGCSQQTDANDTLDAIQKSNIGPIDLLIVDHYSLDERWQAIVLNALSNSCGRRPSLMVIDDLANRKHIADILVDQNYFGSFTNSRYHSLVPNICKILSGPHYALLSPEYSLLARSVHPKRNLKRILVFFGGSDLYNCTLMVVKALANDKYSHLQIDVILGLNSSCREEIVEITNTHPNIQIYDSMPSLAALFIRADLAIGAGGVTTWERCCLSLPSIVITIADNQKESMSHLSEDKSINLLGSCDDITEESICAAVDDYENVSFFSSSGSHHVDGFGVSRVVNSLLGTSFDFTFRRVEIADKYLLWRWANDNSVRTNSFTPRYISLSEHDVWFAKGFNTPDRLHWIASDIHGCPLGQIRFDRDLSTRTILTDFSLDLSVRGQGLASKFISQALALIPLDWLNGYSVTAKVKETNIASYASFRRAGFQVAESSSDGVTTFIFKF